MKTSNANRLLLSLFVAIFFASSFSLHAQNKGANPNINQEELSMHLQKRNAFAIKALSKLSTEERMAVMGLISDVNEAASMTAKSSKQNKSEYARLKKVIAELKNHPKFKGLKWQAADGTTFENREDYLEYQWGVPYPSEGNPYNPFN